MACLLSSSIRQPAMKRVAGIAVAGARAGTGTGAVLGPGLLRCQCSGLGLSSSLHLTSRSASSSSVVWQRGFASTTNLSYKSWISAANKTTPPRALRFSSAAARLAATNSGTTSTAATTSTPTSTSTPISTPTSTLELPDNLTEGETAIWHRLVELAPTSLSVQDVSGGCGTMYSIEIASAQFAGKPVVMQHRMVNACLKGLVEGWHGVQLRTVVS